ncbi:DUF559 domain-containing protein [Roseixanthobacter liquoris]|uniref:DUF559 domain-containing protein n=1 Tax=Roseixanthobacter liquoris TaxID=3119921 RepID=UPI00372D0EF1
MTDAERKLWSHLRAHRFTGLSFRRQVPMGAYIADFVSHGARLVVELDGGQHAVQQDRDRRRDQWFQAQGYRVVRYWNGDVMSNLDGVLEDLARCMSATAAAIPPSQPSPARGEGFASGLREAADD